MLRSIPALPVLLCGLFAAAAQAQTTPADAHSETTWQELKPDVFGERPIAAASPLVRLTAPVRAEEAAMVPITVEVALPEGDPRSLTRLTLIVDENPAPVAATFGFGPERHELTLSTRLRVNAYSYVRAIAELSDGGLHMAASFVKASGGCSAPALKDEDVALKNLGQMRLKLADGGPASRVSKVQLMIRHPNYSGLQMDQVTRLYVPAMYVDHIVAKQGDALIFEMSGGISISEDPNIQVSYRPNGQTLRVDAGDTEGRTFESELKPAS